ncbi:hypothetical protein GBAR_LOCUS18343 [Geodia barretti]|uniref:Uncharacterized protein n=1 Tax=Geodia barretti TaxID=519541 RepID=A0AA35SNN4_GEOBA|nr:hypothetical protein GBAR_LOCUS18343 [Geodia barretti]
MTLDVVNRQTKRSARSISARRLSAAGPTSGWCGNQWCRRTRLRGAVHTARRRAERYAAPAGSRGGRRVPAARASGRSAIRCGGRAARCSARGRAATPTRCRRKWCAAPCGPHWSRSCATAP